MESPEPAKEMACPIVLQAVRGDWQLLLSLPWIPLTYQVVESGVATTVPVTDLLRPAKLISMPVEQRAKPIKSRKLKNVAADFPATKLNQLPNRNFSKQYGLCIG